VSSFGITRLGSSLTVIDAGYFGSSVSLRTLLRFGSSLSAYSFF
jgi:hypothetical protein